MVDEAWKDFVGLTVSQTFQALANQKQENSDTFSTKLPSELERKIEKLVKFEKADKASILRKVLETGLFLRFRSWLLLLLEVELPNCMNQSSDENRENGSNALLPILGTFLAPFFLKYSTNSLSFIFAFSKLAPSTCGSLKNLKFFHLTLLK